MINGTHRNECRLKHLHVMTLLQVITYVGIFVFALTGAFKARSFKMDVFRRHRIGFCYCLWRRNSQGSVDRRKTSELDQ